MLNVKFASESDPETDVSLSFFAADRLIGEVIFSERFLFDIGQLIQKKSDYHLNETLKDVKLPSGQDLEGQFVFIVAKSLKENLDFGVLLNQLESGGYHVVGLWPRDFAEICKQDHEVFEFLMFRLINTPEFFSKVTLYQPAEMKKPKMEVKAPSVELKPPTAPTPQPTAPFTPPVPTPAAAADVKSAVKPAGVEVKVPTPPAAPKPAAVAPPPTVAAPPPAVAAPPPELVEGRCPYCKAPIPEPRLKVLQRGSNTFCPKCLKILKGFTTPVEVKPVSEESLTETTRKEIATLVKQAEQNMQGKDYDSAASNYRKAAAKAKLLDDKKFAAELEGKAEQAQNQARKIKIDTIMKTADDYFRQKSYDAAIKEYKIAIDLAKKIKDNELLKSINTRIRKCAELIVTEKIEGYINTADQLIQQENYAEAKENYLKALELEEKLGEKDIIEDLKRKIADCDTIPIKKKLKEASSKAEKQFKVEKFDEALRYYQEAASYASQLQDSEAQRFFEQKIKECQTAPLRQQIQELISSGDEKFQAQEFDQAANIYRNALTPAKELGDKDVIKNLEDKIAQCETGEANIKLQNILQTANDSLSAKDYSAAKQKFQEAISIAKQIGKSDTIKQCEVRIKECDTRSKLETTLQNAESNFQSKNLEMALNLYKDALKYAESVNDSEKIALANSKIADIQKAILQQNLTEMVGKADVLLAEQKYEDALTKLEQAKQIATQLNDSNQINEIDSKIAETQTAIQKAKEAAAAPAAPAPPVAQQTAPSPAAAEKPAEKPAIQPSGFLCPFCDFPLPEKVVKNLKKGFNDVCPNCHRTLGRRALEL
ncbi:MAG: hypothetical protein ACTSRS_05165 [Candidatus Helarchaeota archaeon]